MQVKIVHNCSLTVLALRRASLTKTCDTTNKAHNRKEDAETIEETKSTNIANSTSAEILLKNVKKSTKENIYQNLSANNNQGNEHIQPLENNENDKSGHKEKSKLENSEEKDCENEDIEECGVTNSSESNLSRVGAEEDRNKFDNSSDLVVDNKDCETSSQEILNGKNTVNDSIVIDDESNDSCHIIDKNDSIELIISNVRTTVAEDSINGNTVDSSQESGKSNCDKRKSIFTEPHVAKKRIRRCGKRKTKSIKAKEVKKESKSNSDTKPMIHITGPLASPLSCAVINNSVEVDKSSKKAKTDCDRVTASVSASDISKMSANIKWVCSICKKPSNHRYMGDLFGPYYPENSDTLESAPNTTQRSNESPKKKRRSKQNVAMNTLPSELWVHEDCSVWSYGVYLSRGRLYGLEDAVLTAQQNVSNL